MRNSKVRRQSRPGRTPAAALTGAALVASALTAAVAQPPTNPSRQFDVDLTAANNVQTAFNFGPIAGLITPLLNSMNPPMNPVDLGGLISYNFSGGAATTRGIYDLLNGTSYTKVSDIPSGVVTCKTAITDACRTEFTFSTGIGTIGMTDAMQALISAFEGQPRAGFDPIKPYAGGTGTTQVVNYYLLNMFRPNGGIAARFPDITKLFGINPDMPKSGYFAAKSPGTSSLWNWTVDFAWPYNPLADFPITANPFALANTMFGVIPPPQLISQIQTPGPVTDKLTAVLSDAAGTIYPFPSSDLTTTKLVLLPQLQCQGAGDPSKCAGYAQYGAQGLLFGPVEGGFGDPLTQGSSATYLTVAAYNPEIPLLYPTKILPALVNPLLKQIKSPYLLGTPTADVLTSALRILINIAYDDVVTPDKLATIDPNSIAKASTYAQENYKAYDRTYAQPPKGDPAVPTTGTPFAWFNNPAMTAEETTKAYADAGTAFVDSLKAQAQKPLFGILVPNPDNPPAAATPAAAAKPAAATSAPADSPSVEAADVSIPALPAIDSASDPDPVDVPAAPKTTRAGAAKAGGGQSSDNDNSGGQSHRGQR